MTETAETTNDIADAHAEPWSPGPWSMELTTTEEGHPFATIFDGNGCPIQFMTLCPVGANARLTAAAPELANAAEPFSAFAARMDGWAPNAQISRMGDLVLTVGDFRALAAAAAKARGEA